MKKIVVSLLAVLLVITCVVSLVACNDGMQDILDNYIFEQEGTTVTEDFVLPATIGEEETKWSSNNAAITLTKNAKDWTATVNHPESGTVEVTLTLTLGKLSKDFKVNVKAIDVYDIADNYTFTQNKATVTKDITLDTTATYKGKTANITWSVDEDYAQYMKVEGNICKVTPQSVQTNVVLKATFTLGEESTTVAYRMTIYKDMEGLELVDYWYTNTGVSITMSGYVVEIGTAYSESYQNVTLYMVNDDFTAGYYLFRVKADVANGTQLRPGVHVTCTGTTNTNYNGLIETNAGGKLVVDSDIEPINVRDHIKAIDNEIIGDVPAAVYNESRLVSLTNWKVKEVKSVDVAAGGTQTLMVLEKEGKTVSVAVSKYLEGAYVSGDETYKALCAHGTSFAKDSYVSVTGILGNYKGYQIMPLATSDIVAGTQDEASTVYPGKDVATAIAAVEKAVKDNALDKRITTTKEATLPVAEGKVSIAYRAINAVALAVGENGAITVTPGNPEQSTLEVTYTCGDFTTVQFFYINSLIPTASTILDDIAAEDVLVNAIKQVIDLPTAPAGAELTWAVKNAGKNNNISISNGQLVPVLEEGEVKVQLTATVTYEGVTKSKTIFLTLAAGKGASAIDMATVAENTPYVLAIDQANLGKQIYVLNQMKSDGNYGLSTDDTDKAASVYVEFVKEEDKVVGYKLYFKNKDTKNYIRITKNGTYFNYNISGTAELSSVFTYDADSKCLKTTDVFEKDGDVYKAVENTEEYYFGTYSSFDTISASKASYAKTSFPAYLGIIEFKALADNDIKVSATNAKVENLSKTSGKNGEKFTFTVSVDEGYHIVSVKAGKTTLTADGNGVYTGTVSGPTTITVVAEADGPQPGSTADLAYTVAEFLEAYKGLESGEEDTTKQVYVKGIVVGTPNENTQYSSWELYIADVAGGTTKAQVYSAKLASGVSKPVEGASIVVYGYVKRYGDTWEIAYMKSTGVSPQIVSCTLPEGSETPGTGTETPVTPPVGDSNTSKIVIADYADANSWVDTKISASAETDYFTATTSCTTPSSNGQNTGKYYENGENWRIYQNEIPSLVITAKTGYTIVSVKVTYTVSNTGIMTKGDAQIASDTVVTVNDTSVTFSVAQSTVTEIANGQIRVTAIEVVYAEA